MGQAAAEENRVVTLTATSESPPKSGRAILRATESLHLNSSLKKVSRSFYLTLRILPRSTRPQIGLAYLLARASDTIADTSIVPVEQRLEALAALGSRISGDSSQPLNFQKFIANDKDSPTHAPNTAGAAALTTSEDSAAQASLAERTVLVRIEEFLACLPQLSPFDQGLVRKVLSIIISGQELDLRRFGAAGPAKMVALQKEDELDDYTYRVAGCVGEFWTHLCRAHVFPTAMLDETVLLANGVRFGKGLQLVNILRDLPADLRQGRCYIPANRLASLGLVASDLLDARIYERFLPLYRDLLGLADAHLQAGWCYTNMIPRRHWRVRLACAWPVIIGVATLAKLRRTNVLDSSQRVKVSRSQVRRIIASSALACIWPPAWERLFTRAKLV